MTYGAKFLEDQPVGNVGQSQFAAHAKIAECIASDILTGDTVRNRRIALVGEWGSGKSTVLSFVKEGLERASQSQQRCSYFLSFDLWSHSGEALQRSFLQAIYLLLDADVRKRRAANAKDARGRLGDWHDLGLKVSSEYRVERSSGTGSVPLISLLVAVVGAVFAVASAVSGAWYDAFSSDPDVGFKTGAIAIIATATVAAVLGAVSFGLRFLRIKRGGVPHPWRALGREVLGPIVGETVVTSETAIAAEVPGPIAFQRYLHDILGCASAVLGPVRIVVALDNLDRLQAERAREAWASVQSFADALSGEQGADPNEDSGAVTWLLLPIAMETAQCLAGEDKLGASSAPGADALGSSTLSKLFIKRYDIPQPIGFEWRGFTVSCLREAFPGVEQDAAVEEFVCAVLETVPDSRRFRAPREVVKLVNDMVSLYRVYGGIEYPLGEGSSTQVGLEAVAVFAVARHTRASKETPEAPLERQIVAFCSHANDALSSQLELPSYVAARRDLFTPLMMMAYGVLDPLLAAARFAIDSMESEEGIRSLDLVRREGDMPGIWGELFRYVKNERLVGLNTRDGKRYRALLEQILSVEPLPYEALPLANEMAARARYSDWVQYANSGLLMAKLVEIADVEVGGVASACKAFGDGSWISVNDSGYATWRDNVFAFVGAVDWVREGMRPERQIVDLDSRTYEFVKDCYRLELASVVFDIIQLVGAKGYASMIEGLVGDLRDRESSGISDPESFMRFVAGSPIYRSAEPLSAAALQEEHSKLGVENAAAYFFMAWFMYRAAGSPVAWSYCERFARSTTKLPALDAKEPFECAACLGACFDRRLGFQGVLRDGADSGELSALDGLASPEAIRVFAFASDAVGNKPFLDMVFDDLESAEPLPFTRRIASTILEEGRALIPEEDYLRYRQLLA